MLIIRRRGGQSVLIGPDIEIQVIEVGPTQVKIGITAPAHVTVQRKEVVVTRERNLTAAQGLGREGLSTFLGRLGAGPKNGEANCQNPDGAVPDIDVSRLKSKP